MKIGICNDHAGVDYKNEIVKMLSERGIETVNFGTDIAEAIDYADLAHPLAAAVESGEVDCGIALCGTGNGMAMTLNHHRGIRAGLAWDNEIAALVKQHNNANVLVMPARFISREKALELVGIWLGEEFQGGRHERRIAKIPVQD